MVQLSSPCSQCLNSPIANTRQALGKKITYLSLILLVILSVPSFVGLVIALFSPVGLVICLVSLALLVVVLSASICAISYLRGPSLDTHPDRRRQVGIQTDPLIMSGASSDLTDPSLPRSMLGAIS